MRTKSFWPLGLVACLGLAIAGFADPKGKPPANRPSSVSTTAQWTDRITEVLPRDCVLTTAKPNGNFGAYTCAVGPPAVTYMLTGVPRTQLLRKGDPELCAFFDDITLETPTMYKYTWTENCGSGGCTIQFINWFSTADSGKIPGVDFVRVVALADVVTGVTGVPFTDPNPFVVTQRLSVYEINIGFSQEGSTKSLAKCQFTPGKDDVVFVSTPVP